MMRCPFSAANPATDDDSTAPASDSGFRLPSLPELPDVELDFKLDLPGDPNLWVSLAAGPMLLGLIGGRLVADTMRQLGMASEEVFRGDRLPLLDWTFKSDDPTAPPTDAES